MPYFRKLMSRSKQLFNEHCSADWSTKQCQFLQENISSGTRNWKIIDGQGR